MTKKYYTVKLVIHEPTGVELWKVYSPQGTEHGYSWLSEWAAQNEADRLNHDVEGK
jgi:hypothetical protein